MLLHVEHSEPLELVAAGGSGNKKCVFKGLGKLMEKNNYSQQLNTNIQLLV